MGKSTIGWSAICGQEQTIQKKNLHVQYIGALRQVILLVVGDVVKHILQSVELRRVEHTNGTDGDSL